MKKILIILAIMLLSISAFCQLPAPNSLNVLFLKFDESEAVTEALVSINNSKVWRTCYLYYSKDSKGRSINREFYVPNENVFWYVNPAAYEAVLKDNNQIRNILDGKRYPEQDDYFRGFRKIYLLDLEQANPNNPNEFKLIEVKPYLPWEH